MDTSSNNHVESYNIIKSPIVRSVVDDDLVVDVPVAVGVGFDVAVEQAYEILGPQVCFACHERVDLEPVGWKLTKTEIFSKAPEETVRRIGTPCGLIRFTVAVFS